MQSDMDISYSHIAFIGLHFLTHFPTHVYIFIRFIDVYTYLVLKEEIYIYIFTFYYIYIFVTNVHIFSLSLTDSIPAKPIYNPGFNIWPFLHYLADFGNHK